MQCASGPFRRWFLPLSPSWRRFVAGATASRLPSEGCPPDIDLIGGDFQGGVVGQKVADTLVVKITDSKDRAVQGQEVAFRLIAGGAGAVLAPDTALHRRPGPGQVGLDTRPHRGGAAGRSEGRRQRRGGGLKFTFTANALADAPDTVFAVLGEDQLGIVSRVLADSLAVVVTDQFGNPIADETVNWTVPGGQGSVSPATVVTGADGRAAVSRTLGPTAGTQTTTATRAGLKGSPVVFDATALPGGAASLVKLHGDSPVQIAPAGQELTDSLVVQTQDANGNGVVRSVGGLDRDLAVAGRSAARAASPMPRARPSCSSRWASTAGSNTVRATSPGLTPVDFTATGIALAGHGTARVSSTAQNGTAGLPVGGTRPRCGSPTSTTTRCRASPSPSR